MTKLEEKRSSGIIITHEFKSELAAVKYVSIETDMEEKCIADELKITGWFDHKFANDIEVTYKLVPA